MQESLITASFPQRETAQPSPVLLALRNATKTRHAILDASMPLSQMDVSWQDYVLHLQLLANWLDPLENWLERFDDGPQGEKAPHFIRYGDIIRTDLGKDFPSLTKTDNWVKTDNPAYRWGVCYVIEGSQLGGEFLYRRLAAHLSPHPLVYLQRKQAGRWPAFLQCMALEVITPEQITAACEGAINAFDALLQRLPLRETL